MALSVTQNIHVSITIDGLAADFDLAPGDEIPAVLEELLTGQGFTTEATTKKSTKPISLDQPQEA